LIQNLSGKNGSKTYSILKRVKVLFSRRVIAYHLSRHLDTTLTLGALCLAISERDHVSGCIHHSDQRVQYTSSDYVKELLKYGFKISMARRGNPYNNAVC